jgi:hypothetical protein
MLNYIRYKYTYPPFYTRSPVVFDEIGYLISGPTELDDMYIIHRVGSRIEGDPHYYIDREEYRVDFWQCPAKHISDIEHIDEMTFKLLVS